jgi:hypothetical protein
MVGVMECETRQPYRAQVQMTMTRATKRGVLATFGRLPQSGNAWRSNIRLSRGMEQNKPRGLNE